MTNKFRNIPTEVDGIRFASKAEARRYQELKLLMRAGEIESLELQKRYPLVVNGVKVGTYVSDFTYRERYQDGPYTLHNEVDEDVKGVATPVFKLKAKLFKAQYGREIKIIR